MASMNPPPAPETTAGHAHAVHDASGHVVHDPVAEDHGHSHSHAHPPSHYKRIWLYLVILFFISVMGPVIGGWLGIWWFTLITAFGIAVVKASLVVKHFMHLDVEQPIVHYFLATALVFMFLFFAGVSPDVMNHHGTGWVNVAANAETARALAEAAAHGDGHGEPGGEAEHAPEAEPAPAH